MPLGTEVLTVEYKLNLLRPAAGAHFEGRGTVVRAGTTLTAAEAAFYDRRPRQAYCTDDRHIDWRSPQPSD